MAVAASNGDYNSQPMGMIVFMAMPLADCGNLEPTGCKAAPLQWPQPEAHPAPCAALGEETSQNMWQQSEGYAAVPFPQAWAHAQSQPTEGCCLPNELVEFRKSKFAAASPEVGYLMEAIWYGGEARESAVQVLLQPGWVEYYSFRPAGTRMIQLALETLEKAVAVQLARDLQGHVVRAMRDKNANHVIQKMIMVLSPSEVPFLVEEIRQEIRHKGLGLVRHELGCRVFNRLLEYGDASTASLMDEVLANAKELIKDQHGKYVIEVALEQGLPDQRERILSELRENFTEHVFDSNGSYVLQYVLHGCEESEAMAAQLLALTDRVLGTVAHNRFGCAVVKTAVESSRQNAKAFLQRFEAPSLEWCLKFGKPGRRLRKVLGVKSQDC